MSNRKTPPHLLSSPYLPSSGRTLTGALFNPQSDVWIIRDATHTKRMDFTSLDATTDFCFSLKLVTLWYIENRSFSTITSVWKVLRPFLKHESDWAGKPVDKITASSLMRYRNELQPNKEYSLSLISYFFKKWYELQIPGVTIDAYDYLSQIRIHRKTKGDLVRTMDIERGPFSNIESNNMLKALEKAFSDKKITLENYSLAILFSLFGARPIQYALMKVCDVLEEDYGDSIEHFIRIPRAKEIEVLPRQDFRVRYIIPCVGKRLMQHAHEIKETFSAILSDSEQAPLFPSRNLTSRNAPAGYQYHNTADTLGQRCKNIYSGLGVISERTGKAIKPWPRRFRYTLATRAAEAGYSILVIADLLDHLNTTYVPVYAKATGTILSRLDKDVAKDLAPIANAFLGSVIEPNTKEHFETEPYPQVSDPRFGDGKSIGRCAHHGPCNLLVPIACYTCANFRPLADAPHERLLEYLLSERSRQYQHLSPALASSNDLTIAAIAQVIRICEEFNRESKDGNND